MHKKDRYSILIIYLYIIKPFSLPFTSSSPPTNIRNKMQAGALATREAVDKRFKELRAQSRQELLSQIYGKEGKKGGEATVEQDLSEAFAAILHNYDFDKAHPTVIHIAQLFNLNLDSIKRMEPSQRQQFLREMLRGKMEEGMRVVQRREEEGKGGVSQENHFQWLGLRTRYTQLRPIFEEILLQKVKLFDSELTRLSECSELPLATLSTGGFNSKSSLRSNTLQSTLRARRVQSDIAEQFCDVKIRDKSEFLLQRWTAREQEEFSAKKAVFRSNLKINNVPVLFQFVKKYTATVKARDNIYRKWEHREKMGITPEEVRYLCATSLFLNNSLAPSEKQRIKNNLHAAGTQLVSRLETNIAQKIIETYHQLMKRVSDLRAKYYEELTHLRKKEQQTTTKLEAAESSKTNRKEQFLKYRAMFERVVNSERMRLRLNARIHKWVKLFVKNLKRAIFKEELLRHGGQSQALFKRLAGERQAGTMLVRQKAKYPSSKVIKREDQYSHRLKYRVYMPSERFHYQPSFEGTIDRLNRTRLTSAHQPAFRKQLTGGPKRNELFVTVDLSKKQVYLSSPSILKYIVAIQAKWRSVYQRKRFLTALEEARQKQQAEFEARVQSLKRLYPPGVKVNLRAVEGRLRRVHMKLTSILHPYVRTPKRPTNTYTAFCTNALSPSDLKNKHARNGQIRLGEFVRMVEQNQYGMLLKSGIVVTSREINGTAMARGGNPMWWAVFHSNLDLTRKFLEGGGDPNSADAEENTCLHVAVRNGDMQIVFLLLDYGADLNRKNSKKASCLLHAGKQMLKLLGLEEGSVLGEKDNNGLFYRRTMHEDPYSEHYY